MRKRWLVHLTDDERAELEALTRRGKAPARKVAHARVLLLASEGLLTDDEIAAATGRSRSLVERTRKRFVLSGLEVALLDKPRRGGIAKLDERGRATLIALACASIPGQFSESISGFDLARLPCGINRPGKLVCTQWPSTKAAPAVD